MAAGDEVGTEPIGPVTSPDPITEAEEQTSVGQTYPTTDDSLTATGQGTVVGRIRIYDEDNDNLQNLQNIQAVNRSISLTQSRNAITAAQPATKPVVPTKTNSATTIASKTTDTAVAIAAAANRAASVKSKDSVDITRAQQKLQRRCNHSYSKIIDRCIYCNKHRDSHVYDV
ncbi:hypothetical protein LCGC14_0977460 [marine sediment metagenome]|uniref:Uncharacterized protein n=1 Tax=marine sediment metagenome TaxID=412755 RepID=A0A0F9N9V9_9ZZZZ